MFIEYFLLKLYSFTFIILVPDFVIQSMQSKNITTSTHVINSRKSSNFVNEEMPMEKAMLRPLSDRVLATYGTSEAAAAPMVLGLTVRTNSASICTLMEELSSASDNLTEEIPMEEAMLTPLSDRILAACRTSEAAAAPRVLGLTVRTSSASIYESREEMSSVSDNLTVTTPLRASSASIYESKDKMSSVSDNLSVTTLLREECFEETNSPGEVDEGTAVK